MEKRKNEKKKIITDTTKNIILIIGVIVLGIILLAIALALIYLSIFTDRVINFDTATVISVVLAFFSIGISISFYFKATQTSNDFYDNSYVHMKEQSELLGRIDEKFGEKFNTVELMLNGLSGLKRGLQNTTDYMADESCEEKNENVEKINEVIESSNIEPDEKEKLKAEIQEKNRTIDMYQQRSRDMSENIDRLMHEINYLERKDNYKRHIEKSPYDEVMEAVKTTIYKFIEGRKTSDVLRLSSKIKVLFHESSSKHDFMCSAFSEFQRYLDSEIDIDNNRKNEMLRYLDSQFSRIDS